jgi:nucleotide-binding universal stress UspA family protein
MAHVLGGEPVSTSPEHALAEQGDLLVVAQRGERR